MSQPCKGCGALSLEGCVCHHFDDDRQECYKCGGRGEFVDCCDDLCYGQEYCIHGDPPAKCDECGGTGYA